MKTLKDIIFSQFSIVEGFCEIYIFDKIGRINIDDIYKICNFLLI